MVEDHVLQLRGQRSEVVDSAACHFACCVRLVVVRMQIGCWKLQCDDIVGEVAVSAAAGNDEAALAAVAAGLMQKDVARKRIAW